jgi:AraC-like DNA-binding protein
VMHSTLNPHRTFVQFLADANQPPIHYSGLELSVDAIALAGGGTSRHIRCQGTSRWASMSLSQDDLSTVSCTLLGHELTAEPITRVIHPNTAHLNRLVGLHASARHLANATRDVLEHPEVSRALEHELIHAMVDCLAEDVESKIRRGWHHHTAIIKRFDDFLDANADAPLYLADICAAVGASRRTLHLCCEEHLGMSPLRYLWLRRMHLARHALIRADPADTTVTQIAGAHGFWELGRFAVKYRRLFGEQPSATLNRSSADWLVPKNHLSGFADSKFA